MDFMSQPLPWLEWTGVHMSPWKLIGLTGTLMFGGRWLVQFIASKREGKPVIPRLFWYMSILGSLMTLSYFIFGKNDAVGILGNLFPNVHRALQPVPGHPPPRLEAGQGRALSHRRQPAPRGRADPAHVPARCVRAGLSNHARPRRR